MLCSNCYKKIPEGKEVAKSGKNYFRASWHSGYGTEIYCKKCAIKKDRFDRICLIVFFSIFLTMSIVGIIVLIYAKTR